MCGSPYFLTVRDELARCQVPERAVRPLLVVVEAPGFDLLPRVLERDELMHVQAPVAQAPVVEPRPGAQAPGCARAGRSGPWRGSSDTRRCDWPGRPLRVRAHPDAPARRGGCSLNNTGGGSAATPTSTNGP